MTANSDGGAVDVTRRDLLAAGAGLAAGAASGCLQRVRSLVDRPSSDQLSLTIKTLPADTDEPATRIATLLSDHLEAVGVDAERRLLREDELRRDILTKGEFDLYVTRMPLAPDPDFLRPRLHSVFVGESGWQNPFDFTDLTLDEQLTEQRRTAGRAREAAIGRVQETVARLQPFAPVAVPDEVSATRDGRFAGWGQTGLASPLDLLRLDATGSGPADRLRMVATDGRVTSNHNPIAEAFRDRGTITGMLYEPLGRQVDGEMVPWLATDWEWSTDEDGTSVRVTLRDGLSWHDGESLTPDDVAFTYRFVDDTTLGEREAAVPAPRYRGRSSLIESVTILGADELRIDVGDTTPEVGRRALSVPVLPEHVWRAKSVEAELAGVGVNDRVTEALVWENRQPVGSGPLAFAGRSGPESVRFERHEPHFLHRPGVEPPASELAGGVDFEELVVRLAPSMGAAVSLVASDAADATTPGTDPDVVPQIGSAGGVSLHVGPSPWLYHVGFQTSSEPLGNPHVRRTIARLLDKEWIVDEILDGYGRAAASPLAGTDWVPGRLTWNGTAPEVPFAGTDGELDAERARQLFRDIGYQYADDRLLRR